MEFSVLNNDDLRLLKLMIQDFKNKVQGGVSHSTLEYIPKSPDVYIALPQDSGGIPALQRVGSASTAGAGDIPGSAVCDIHRISEGSLEAMSFEETVYNLSTSAIDQDWIQVHRDKTGNWLAITGGGGGNKLVKVIEETSFPSTQIGPVFFYAEEYTVGGTEVEGNVPTLTASGTNLYVAQFRPNITLKDLFYVANKVGSFWVIDNQATWLDGM